MNDVITIGEKGQIVIPKQIRDDLNIEKGSRLIITQDKEKIIIKLLEMNDDYFWMLLGESSLAKVWDNPEDARWDDVL